MTKQILIAILLLGACSAQYFSQEEVEASFENDLKDLDALTKDMDFDENFDFLEGAEDEEDPFDFEEEDEMDPDSYFFRCVASKAYCDAWNKKLREWTEQFERRRLG